MCLFSETMFEYKNEDPSARKLFPFRLHQLLSEAEQRGVNDIIAWDTSGTKFIIHKPKELESKILKTFFNQSKIASFKRQLNAYGFKRISIPEIKESSKAMIYTHESFTRDDPSSCQRITRRNYSPFQVDSIPAVQTTSEEINFKSVASADITALHEDTNEKESTRHEAALPVRDFQPIHSVSRTIFRPEKVIVSHLPSEASTKKRRARSWSPAPAHAPMQQKASIGLQEDFSLSPSSNIPPRGDTVLDELAITVDRNIPLDEHGRADMNAWDPIIESLSNSFSSSSSSMSAPF